VRRHGDRSAQCRLGEWAKRPQLAKAYLDWLLSPEAQGIWADSYWQPIIPEYLTENAKTRMKPLHGSYSSIIKIDIPTKRDMVDPLKQAWLETIKRQ
jgi:ABC-type Fe3+ transport system substrate-binding protein